MKQYQTKYAKLIHNGILFSLRTKAIPVSGNNMNEPEGHAKEKRQAQKHKYCMIHIQVKSF